MPDYHLAQINIAKMQVPKEHPQMADFVAQLDRINQLAEDSPGFVWRLIEDDEGLEAQRVFGDPRLLVNMSLWASFESLKEYVYSSAHRDVLRDRQRWFDAASSAHLALWWIPAGNVPTLEDAKFRLELITSRGVGPKAFTFSKYFPPPARDT